MGEGNMQVGHASPVVWASLPTKYGRGTHGYAKGTTRVRQRNRAGREGGPLGTRGEMAWEACATAWHVRETAGGRDWLCRVREGNRRKTSGRRHCRVLLPAVAIAGWWQRFRLPSATPSSGGRGRPLAASARACPQSSPSRS